jgi:Fe2+-dicitrate sensor, membrane component
MTRENEATPIPEQAEYWWVLLRDSDASSTDNREFVEWVTRSPERVEACLRVAQVHAAVSRADMRWPQTSAEDLVRAALAAPGDSVVPLGPHVRPKREEERPRPVLRWAAAMAASVLVAVCLGWWLTFSPAEQFQTKVGEQRSVVLADGSRVTLNTASRIEVRLQAKHRVVELLQGEALFEVAHDEQRPFDVHMGNIAVRAVGTQFNIDRRAARTVVTVLEGRVAVVAGVHGNLPVLSAADQVTVDAAGLSTLQRDVNLTEAIAWTQHQLVFKHRLLGEVAAEFNRYNVGQIEIRSAALRAEEVTGTFRTQDVESFLAVLAGIPGVQVAADGAGGYVVTSAAQQ